MKFLDRYNSVLTFQVYLSKETLTHHIIQRSKNPIIDKDFIKVDIRPSFFDPFAPKGYLMFVMVETSNPANTNVRCEVYSTSINETQVYMLGFFLSFWSITGIVFWPSLNSLLTILSGWVMIILIIHITQTLNRAKLENYIKYLLGNIKRVRLKGIG